MWNSLEIVLVRMSEKLSKKQWEMKNCQVEIEDKKLPFI